MARTKKLPGNRKNFGQTQPMALPRSTFNLSKNWKGTFDAGFLIPFFLTEIIPGDTRKVRASAIARLSTPIKPIFDNIYLDFHFWFAPSRQLYENWEKLMGEQENPGDSIDFLVPQVAVGQSSGDIVPLADYMGIPVSNLAGTNVVNVSALPFRMYNRIYNFHYRDQNLIDSIPQAKDDGPDPNTDYSLKRRGKRHDYLSASLPFRQKGDPVDLPLGQSAPIFTTAGASVPISIGDNGFTATTNLDTTVSVLNNLSNNTGPGVNLFADLAASTAATINDLRQAIAIQHVLERDARSGTRYPEILLSRFRVMDPQMLVLQRPEYLGGGTVPVNISPISQTSTSGTDTQSADTPQGNLAAVGTAMVNNIGFTRSFTEHGFVMGIVSARADMTYQQGLERLWSRRARFDFYTPELAHLSEEEVLAKEIYCTGSPTGDNTVWGYVGAYDSYRYGMSIITSRFRSTDPQTLDIWHLSQQYNGQPTLNQTFIEEDPPIDRVIAVQSEPHFIMDCFISDIAARPMPISGIPGLSRI